MKRTDADVTIVGGGVIGLSLAWRLAQRQIHVRVFERDLDPASGGAASDAAGGMLAPSAELQFEEIELYRLQVESGRRWPSFAQELTSNSGCDVGYRDEGTLMVAVDRDDAEAFRRLYRFQKEADVPVEWLAPAEALEREPFLSPRIAGAIHAPGDHQVDNRAVMRALKAILAETEHATVDAPVEVSSIEPDSLRPAVHTTKGGRFESRLVVLAAGAWSGRINGLPQPLSVRPVKGQMLSLEMEPPFALRHVVRTPRAYLVPKASGRLVIGATSEEMGFDTRLTGGGVYRLLEGAVEVVPGVEELTLAEVWAGLRPASRDHRPLLGFGFAPGVVLATGHFRHGILLAPITADELAVEIAAHLNDLPQPSEWLRYFAPAQP